MINSTSFFTRSLLLGILLILLSACVDNGIGGTGINPGMNNQTISNGMGGTGISTGRITAFGSVYVNGIKFNTDQAQFIRNGEENQAQSDFLAGEVVTIKGTYNREAATGVASEVSYSYLLLGPITDVGEDSITVLNTAVSVNSLTVFHGLQQLNDLSTNEVVEVSGFRGAQGRVYATSIRRLDVSDRFKLTGSISQLDSVNHTFVLNGQYTVDYSAVSETVITELGFYEVQALGVLVGDKLIAVAVESLDASGGSLGNSSPATGQSANNATGATGNSSGIPAISPSLTAGEIYDIEGAIAQSFLALNDVVFVNGYSITVDANTSFINGSQSDLISNSIVRVKSEVDVQGKLVASEIHFLERAQKVAIRAAIEGIDIQAGTLQVLGKTLDVSSSTRYIDFSPTLALSVLNLGSYSIGDSVLLIVDVRGNQSGEVESLTKLAPISALYLSSSVASIQKATGVLDIYGVTVETHSDTVYFDAVGNAISQANFFEQLQAGHYASVEGGRLATTESGILAYQLRLGYRESID